MKVAVIGLGVFGLTVLRNLVASHVDVIAIDRSPEVIARISGEVLHAVSMDATDGELLKRQGVNEVDVAVIAIGEQQQSAILATALTLELGVPRVIARATSTMLAKILKRIGAHEIINPEEEAGEHLAQRILAPQLVDFLPLTGDWQVVEIEIPPRFVGKSLSELGLRARFSVTVLAILSSEPQRPSTFSPAGDATFQVGDRALLLAQKQVIEKLSG